MDSNNTARQAAKLAHGVQSVEFPSPFIFEGNHIPITLVELRMRRFSGMIRAKLGWWEKVHDTELVAKWRAEMVEQDRSAVNTFWGGEGKYDVTPRSLISFTYSLVCYFTYPPLLIPPHSDLLTPVAPYLIVPPIS